MTEKYILDGDTPVECDNLLKWGQWMMPAMGTRR